MMRRLVFAALSAVLVLAFAGPVGATHGGPHPTFRTEQTYFHCAGETKVQNLSYTQGQIPSWNTTPPPGSVQAGHGCGYYDPLVNNVANGDQTVALDAVWRGTFSGNLRDLTVELHRLLPAQGATFPNRLVVVLTIDDEERINNNNVVITPAASSTGASQSAKITITDLGYAIEDGDGTQQRTVTMGIKSFNETQSIWVFDTTEVPAGITFNPAAPSGTVVSAA
jgi:hypothetical protein